MPNILPSHAPFVDYIVYGPIYHKNEHRNMVVLVKKDKTSRTSMSYPRYLMSIHLQRRLLKDEHVDHINNDKLDDRIENFQLLDPRSNVLKSAKPASYTTFNCHVCGALKTVAKGKDFNYKKRGYAHCSRKCGYITMAKQISKQ